LPGAYAQGLILPQPGTMVQLSPSFNPPLLKGIKVYPNEPLRLDFILDRGDKAGNPKEESTKLIKYFLAAITIPEKDLWVNLSPYEKDRIIPEGFGQTQMGRDLLAEDYILKQVTASLIYPEGHLGQYFWKKIYQEAAKQWGTTNIPVNTFNKVWIMPDKAVVYQNAATKTAYVVESSLKVLLEEDYLSIKNHHVASSSARDVASLSSRIVREIVIPQLTKEINTGKNFASLRQAYNSLILATWYKRELKEDVLFKTYANQNKVMGVRIKDIHEKDKIYEQYLRAFKKGVYNYIREDVDLSSPNASTHGRESRDSGVGDLGHTTITRKYFSGGVNCYGLDRAMTITENIPSNIEHEVDRIKTKIQPIFPRDAAQASANTHELEIDHARLLMPVRNYEPGEPLDIKLIRQLVKRNATQVRQLLKEASRRNIVLEIIGHLRGLDGPGSALDLPDFQKTLTTKNVQGFEQMPSTMVLASDKKLAVRFELADDPHVIEYVSPEHGIGKDRPLRFTHDIDLTHDGRLPRGQIDAVGYIFRNIFGLEGIRITLESISPIALAGGMESSNVFTVALLTAGSILSGANLSYADIVALAVKLENDEIGGLTGGQGHWSAILGSAQRLIWLSGIKNSRGEFVNNYGVVAQEALSNKQMDDIESHALLLQAGKEYQDGKAAVDRTAKLTITMWTDLLIYDPFGNNLQSHFIALTNEYVQALIKGDFQKVAETINQYVTLRNYISMRWINLVMDTHRGIGLGHEAINRFVKEFERKVFRPSTDEERRDYAVIREWYEEYESKGQVEKLRPTSLYSLDPIASLIEKAKEKGIALFPLGAGGPGSNILAISPQGVEYMKDFFDSHDIHEITDSQAAQIIGGTGVLKGYMPFHIGRKGMEILGFTELPGVIKPELPELTTIHPESVGIGTKLSSPDSQNKAMATLDGGIDFNPANIHLTEQGSAIKFNMDPSLFKKIQKAIGFAPFILSTQSTTLRAFLMGDLN